MVTTNAENANRSYNSLALRTVIPVQIMSILSGASLGFNLLLNAVSSKPEINTTGNDTFLLSTLLSTASYIALNHHTKKGTSEEFGVDKEDLTYTPDTLMKRAGLMFATNMMIPTTLFAIIKAKQHFGSYEYYSRLVEEARNMFPVVLGAAVVGIASTFAFKMMAESAAERINMGKQ